MTWVPCNAKKSISIRAPLDKVLAYLSDPEQSGRHWGGIERIEKQGDGVYRWILAERSTAGLKFKGDYVVRFATNGKDEVTFGYVSGNFKSNGRYRFTTMGDNTLVDMSIENEADAPVPGLLKSVAKLFAQSEVEKGLDTFANAVRRSLEQA